MPKKKVLILISAVLVVILCITIIYHNRGGAVIQYPNTNYLPNGIPSRSLGFSLIGSSDYDPSNHIGEPFTLRNHDGSSIMIMGGYIVEGTLVKWVHVRDIDAMHLMSEANGFTEPCEMDFEKNDLIISFGREITEMQCFTNDHFNYPEDLEVLAVTYGSRHHSSKVFFYQIPKTKIVYYEHMAPYYYHGKWGSGGARGENTGTVVDWERAQQDGYENGK